MFGRKKNKIKAPWLKNYTDVPETIEYPDVSIYTLFDEAAQKYSNYTAYTYFNKTGSYSSLHKNIKKCAKSLRNFGIEKGDVVTLCLANTPEALICFYAVNMIGAVANMIHPLSASNEIKHYLEVSNSKMLITIDITWEKVAPIIDETNVDYTIIVSAKDSMSRLLSLGYIVTAGRKVKTPKASDSIYYWKDFIELGSSYRGDIYAKMKGDDIAVVMYSGGTTGEPKGIVLTNMNCNSVALASIPQVSEIGAGDSILGILPTFHSFGLIVGIHTVLLIGVNIVQIPRFNPKTFLKLISKTKVSAVIGVPTLFESMIKTEEKNLDLSFLKLCISGGDSLSATLKHRIDEFFSAHGATIGVREGYGLTESASAACLCPREAYKEGSIGLPYPDVYFKIVTPYTHTEVSYGEEGEICISGPSVMKGYLNDAEETAKVLQVHPDGRTWLHTNDIGTMDEEGYVYFKYRLKRMIVSNGYNVYPSYVENVIDSHPKVSMSTVIGIEHKYKKQVPKAFIVLKPGVEPTKDLKKEILDLCKNNLVDYSIPYEIEYRTELPKTTIGKVAYGKLEEEEKEKKSRKKAQKKVKNKA